MIDLPRRKLLGKIKTPRPRQTSGRETLASLLQDADVFVQGYRPGAIAGFGFDPSGLPRPNDGNRRRAVFGIMRQVDGGGPDPSAIARVVGLNRAAANRFWTRVVVAKPAPTPTEKQAKVRVDLGAARRSPVEASSGAATVAASRFRTIQVFPKDLFPPSVVG